MAIYRMRPDRAVVSGWKILTIADIPYYVEISFLIFIGIITLFDIQNGHQLSEAGLFAFVIFFSLLLHESGHALTARFFGYRPISVSLLAFGGLTRHPPASRGQGFFIVLAGPLVTLVLAAVPRLAFHGFSEGWFPSTLLSPALIFVLEQFLFINIFWLIFNLLPIYPMDGGQALFYLLSYPFSEARALLVSSIISMIACLLAGFFAFKMRQQFVGFFILMFFMQNLQIFQACRRR